MRDFAQAADERRQHFFYILIHEPLGPVERGKKYEDPLTEALGELGKVTGSGSMLREDKTVAFFGIDVVVNDRDRGLKVIRQCLQTCGAADDTVIEEYIPEFNALPLRGDAPPGDANPATGRDYVDSEVVSITSTPAESAPWIGSLVQHEGFPMALRVRPKADSPANRKAFTRSLVVTHELANVKPNGLPEDEYNHSLAAFDRAVHRFIEGEQRGLVVIVETYAGKRIYYCYVDATATFKDRYAKLKAEYPVHKLTIGHCEEPTWETYELYRKLFPW